NRAISARTAHEGRLKSRRVPPMSASMIANARHRRKSWTQRMMASLPAGPSAILAGADVARPERVAMVQMRLHCRFGNFEGAALVADNHFLGGITGIGMAAGD